MVSPLLLLPLLVAPAQEVATRAPGEGWLRYADPADAGFSAAALDAAQAMWEQSDSAAFLIVDRGIIVAAWGDVTRRYMCHSTRKSLLSGLIGVHVQKGEIDLNATLAELDIDDQEPTLTEEEKGARVIDLLKARSGVYRLAAYEPAQNPKPPRGSHAPGTNWCYNNWDFNTLATIFNQETGTEVFEEFGRAFAQPMGMQDYRVYDGYYHYELDKSMHPAYPFRLSARDMARFGLLYLDEGLWGDDRILEASWVEDSRTSYSESWVGGYGYMWWTLEDPRFGPSGVYAALGVGGQMIAVVPDHGLVCVNRTNTYLRGNVPNETLIELIAAAIEARTGKPIAEPKLVPLAPFERPCPPGEAAELEPYVGSYALAESSDPSDKIEARMVDGVLLLEFSFIGTFALSPRGDGVFWMEDIQMHVRLQPSEKGKGALDFELMQVRGVMQLATNNRADEGIEAAERLVELFPESAWSLFAMAFAFNASQEKEMAIDLCRSAIELDPNAAEIRGWLGELEAN